MASDLGHAKLMREGIYIMIGGPTFSSAAEARVLRMFGADAVGEFVNICFLCSTLHCSFLYDFQLH